MTQKTKAIILLASLGAIIGLLYLAFRRSYSIDSLPETIESDDRKAYAAILDTFMKVGAKDAHWALSYRNDYLNGTRAIHPYYLIPTEDLQNGILTKSGALLQMLDQVYKWQDGTPEQKAAHAQAHGILQGLGHRLIDKGLVIKKVAA